MISFSVLKLPVLLHQKKAVCMKINISHIYEDNPTKFITLHQQGLAMEFYFWKEVNMKY